MEFIVSLVTESYQNKEKNINIFVYGYTIDVNEENK